MGEEFEKVLKDMIMENKKREQRIDRRMKILGVAITICAGLNVLYLIGNLIRSLL